MATRRSRTSSRSSGAPPRSRRWAAISKALTATDEASTADAWAAADKQVTDDVAVYPVANTKWATYHATQTHNCIYLDTLQGFDPANMWLDPAKNGG